MTWNEETWKEMNRAGMKEMKGTAYYMETIANGREWKETEEMNWNQMEMAVNEQQFKKMEWHHAEMNGNSRE